MTILLALIAVPIMILLFLWIIVLIDSFEWWDTFIYIMSFVLWMPYAWLIIISLYFWEYTITLTAIVGVILTFYEDIIDLLKTTKN